MTLILQISDKHRQIYEAIMNTSRYEKHFLKMLKLLHTGPYNPSVHRKIHFFCEKYQRSFNYKNIFFM